MGADGYATAIEPLLDEFVSPPVVVGHSFGGRVAVCLAAGNPGRVGRLVLTGSPLLRLGPGPAPSIGYRLARGLKRLGVLSDQQMEAMRKSRGSADYRASSGVMRDILVMVVNESYEPQLRALATPVALLWGSEDHVVPVAVAERALTVIAEGGGIAKLEILAGVGHLIPTEAPDALRRIVDEALQS